MWTYVAAILAYMAERDMVAEDGGAEYAVHSLGATRWMA